MNIRFIIFGFILFLIICVSEYMTYASLHTAGLIKSTHIEVILMSMGVIFPIIFISTMVYGYKHYSELNSWLNTISAVWLGIVFYIFIASLVVFILILVNSYWNLYIPIKLISSILIILMLSIVTYGIINADNPRIVRWSIKSDKLSKEWSGKKIVIISDVHIGTARKEEFLNKVVSKIDAEKPDIVFILGDLIDGSSFPYQKWLSLFNTLKPELGIQYIEGNHEKYSQEYEKFKSEIPASLNNLTDKKAIINNTQIIGLNYAESYLPGDINKELESLGYNKSQPSIILMHNPKNTADLAVEGANLVLSGHTHLGQIFPFSILVRSMYGKYTHGVAYTGETASLTSSGVGTSVLPLRIGTVPEIIVLTIK